MDPDQIVNLFDSCWFTLEILKKQARTSNSPVSKINPDHQIQENSPKPKFSSLPTILIRSRSDQLSSMTTFISDSLSPNSVLHIPHLQTIPSGKEATQEEYPVIEEDPPKKIRGVRRKTKKGVSKSLSDLEFEELKGFMDLGFVFSEEDKDSSLVEIIPGLQRLGMKEDGEEQETHVDESSVPRPYLSEAWESYDEGLSVL
ncbi:hypothetical protein F0562_018141 [Nyssa sinensis]|uniref:DUF1685 domain-containing protein n=1 Tax=Nyssa sinensis TaxID=561372 RepID=A0A5J4ZBD0_9ASTE|nr:hypothetical protein F0562_018141 [Nyssa sinensis]